MSVISCMKVLYDRLEPQIMQLFTCYTYVSTLFNKTQLVQKKTSGSLFAGLLKITTVVEVNHLVQSSTVTDV